ncbi:hypothetical protein [Thalassiella azotivora]
MRTLRATATVAVVAATVLATAPTAAAKSFTDRVRGAVISYDDGEDRFCAKLVSDAGYDTLSVRLYPVVAGRGPEHYISLVRGERKCRSLATAYEDSAYRYSGVLGNIPVDRGGYRLGGEFYS